MKRVAIIGGGISGLAAAWWLNQASPSTELKLFEASHRVGGVIETLQDGPYLIEKAADNFATLIPDALELSQASGLEDQLIPPASKNRQALVLNRGRLYPIPAGFSLMQPTRVLSILATRTLSLRGKMRLLGEFFVPARQDSGDESLESFVTRRLGREAFESLVEPIVSGIFTANPATLSMQATMPQFLAMERNSGGLIRGHLSAKRKDAVAAARRASGARYNQFRAPTAGMSGWLNAIAAQLPADTIQLNSPIDSLTHIKDSTAWRIDHNGQQQDFEAVICATPAAVTSRLLAQELPEASQLVGSIPYASSVVVAMVVNKADIQGRLDAFGMIAPTRENRKALAISYTSNKYPGRTPDDEVLLRIFMGGAMRPEVMDLSDAELEACGVREVTELLRWTGSVPNWIRVIRWNNAMPQYLVGHCDRMQRLDELLTAQPTLRLCGAAYSGVGIPQCIKSGRKAAEAIAANL